MKFLSVVILFALAGCGKDVAVSTKETAGPPAVPSPAVVPSGLDEDAGPDAESASPDAALEAVPMPELVVDAGEAKRKADTLPQEKAIGYLLTWAKHNFAASKNKKWAGVVTCVEGALLEGHSYGGWTQGVLFSPGHKDKFVLLFSPVNSSKVAEQQPKYLNEVRKNKFCGVRVAPRSDSEYEKLVGFFSEDAPTVKDTASGPVEMVDYSYYPMHPPKAEYYKNLPADRAGQVLLDIKQAVLDTSPEDVSLGSGADKGTAFFWVWADRNLTLADLKVISDETTFGAVMKDSDSERGKRLCASGTVIQIEKIDLRPTIRESFTGLLLSGGGIVQFYSFGSTGSVVGSTHTRFCGVVMGQYHYSNSGGGTSHAISVVGMFDIPENRK